MNNLVKVEIAYSGYISKIVGSKKESIELINDIQSIPVQIGTFLKDKYAIKQPVLILIDGRNIISYMKAYEGEKIKEGSCFEVMPVISGG